jgi:dTDP-4-amino-4,6-dideoxygalactose transaminase
LKTNQISVLPDNNDKKLLMLRTHGIHKDASKFKNSKLQAIGNEPGTLNTEPETYPEWYYEMQNLGYNYRLTDFQAALGNSQLKKADDGSERRRDIAKAYYAAFNDKPFIKGQSGTIEGHAYHLYIIEVNDRLKLYNYLRSQKIFAQIHYIPVHTLPYYKGLGWSNGDFPIAENYYKNCLSLPMYPTLTIEEQNFVIKKINEFYA